VFHVELRQFPHNACRFNLSEAELLALVGPWARGEWIEFGERKWSPHQARLTVLEGPHLSVQELSMGRGWRNATRQSEDVTKTMLTRANASAREASAPGRAADATAAPDRHREAASARSEDAAPASELLALLGDDPAPLLAAWQLVARRRPELSPSECLALAEETLRSLG
jgi:hypothetical protein